MTLDWDAPVGYAHATRLANLPTKEVTVTNISPYQIAWQTLADHGISPSLWRTGNQIARLIEEAVTKDRAQRDRWRETEVVITQDEDGSLTVGVWEEEDGSGIQKGVTAIISPEDLKDQISEAIGYSEEFAIRGTTQQTTT